MQPGEKEREALVPARGEHAFLGRFHSVDNSSTYAYFWFFVFDLFHEILMLPQKREREKGRHLSVSVWAKV